MRERERLRVSEGEERPRVSEGEGKRGWIEKMMEKDG